MRLFALILILAGTTQALAQHPAEAIVQSILLNNTTLKADAEATRASQAENLTGLTLADPEVEVSYYWGSPHAIGNRTDISASQRFDYATLFGLKKKLAKSRNEVLDLEHELRWLTLEGEVRQLLVDLTYLNQQQAQLAERIQAAKSLHDKYQKAVQQGDASRFERDKSQLALLSLQAERDELAIAQQQILSQLTTYNAGQPITYTATDYYPAGVASSSIFQAPSSPTTAAASTATVPGDVVTTATRKLLDAQAKTFEEETRTARSASLPELTAGYASELLAGEKFRGVTIGLSLPLWSNRNAVRAAKARQTAHQSQAEDALLQLQQQRHTLRQSMEAHRTLADQLNQTIKESTTLPLLRRALELGELSLLDYLQESSLLYDLQDKALQAEHEYQQARNAWLLLGE